MKKAKVILMICFVFLLGWSIKCETYAYTAWTKNEQGVYINSKGIGIERAAARGIDISKYQYPPYKNYSIEWDKVAKEDIDFVIIRTGAGLTADETLMESMNACDALGIPYGIYHYTHAKTEAEAKAEAEFVLSLIQGRNLSYPVYFDLEGDPGSAMWAIPNEQYLKNAKMFCQVIENAGYQTGIYANKNWFQHKLIDPWYKTKNRWLARYIYDYTYGWEEMIGFYGIWQCTNTGNVAGIDGNVDINFMIEDVPTKVNFTKAASASYNKHTLTWTGLPGVTGYEIWCKKPGSGKYTKAATVAGNVISQSISKRTTGKIYSYKIRAYKVINGTTYYGEYSSVKKAKAVPGQVTLRSVKRSSNTKVTIKWKKVSGASGYKIYYSRKKGSGYKLLKTVKKGSTTSAKVSVKKGKKYYYKVRAYRTVSKNPVYGKYSSVKSCK